VCIYLHGSTPLWFTTDQAGVGERAYPSLYMLHVAPQILPAIRVHAGLGKKLLTTDLFMPGILLSHVCVTALMQYAITFGPYNSIEPSLGLADCNVARSMFAGRRQSAGRLGG
jgi:hypothetical protein